MSVPYPKQWLSVSDQINVLESRGLAIPDRQSAESFLLHLNYYRFSGYGLAFEDQRHSFYAGTTFESIRSAYEFDRDLRDLITEALEIIELDLRSAVAYTFGRQHGAFGHTVATNSYGRFDHGDWLRRLHAETQRSREQFVRHFSATYSEYPDLPAGNAWASPALPDNRHLFAALLVQAKMLTGCSAEAPFAQHWKARVEALLYAKAPSVQDASLRMGLAENWSHHSVWNAL